MLIRRISVEPVQLPIHRSLEKVLLKLSLFLQTSVNLIIDLVEKSRYGWEERRLELLDIT